MACLFTCVRWMDGWPACVHPHAMLHDTNCIATHAPHRRSGSVRPSQDPRRNNTHEVTHAYHATPQPHLQIARSSRQERTRHTNERQKDTVRRWLLHQCTQESSIHPSIHSLAHELSVCLSVCLSTDVALRTSWMAGWPQNSCAHKKNTVQQDLTQTNTPTALSQHVAAYKHPMPTCLD